MFLDAFDAFAPLSADALSSPDDNVTTAQGAAELLRDGYHWGGLGQPVTLSYAYRASDATYDNGAEGFERFNPDQIRVAELALQSWADVANIDFNRVGSGTSGEGAYSNSAQILFGNYTSGPEGVAAFAYYPGTSGAAGDVWVDFEEPYNPHPGIHDYGMLVLVHEIGHTLGLQHPGDYDAGDGDPLTYETDAAFAQDTLQYSVMSYFSELESGADFNDRFAAAPQLFDIAAVQKLYGANTDTRSGDTVYGCNSTAGRIWYDIGFNPAPVFCVWDGGGIDTLDFSSHNDNQVIDLREGAFSSVYGMRDNVSIAMGVTVENAVGGAGNDRIYGNEADNLLSGGSPGSRDTMQGFDGDDTLLAAWADDVIGGAGFDVVDYSRTGVSLDLLINGGNGQNAGGKISSIERIIGSLASDVFTIRALGANIDGETGDDQFVFQSISAPVTLAGGGGIDTITYQRLGGGVDVQLSAASFSGIENLFGSTGNDRLAGDDASNLIRGMAGDDTMRGATDGGDTLDGGQGYDTVSWAGLSGMFADLVGGNKYGHMKGVEHLILTGKDDILWGSGDVVTVNAGGGDDSLRGGGAGETLLGESGADLMTGGGGNDLLSGGDGADDVDGGAGADLILGDGGGDMLKGGKGADTLVGGLGPDRMSGGSEADVFRFDLPAEAPGGRRMDRIEDFRHGQDRIDLSALAGELGFVGEAGFTGAGAGEVRIDVTGQGRVVQVDVDGDGDADMAFLLAGAGQITASDFIL